MTVLCQKLPTFFIQHLTFKLNISSTCFVPTGRMLLLVAFYKDVAPTGHASVFYRSKFRIQGLKFVHCAYLNMVDTFSQLTFSIPNLLVFCLTSYAPPATHRCIHQLVIGTLITFFSLHASNFPPFSFTIPSVH